MIIMLSEIIANFFYKNNIVDEIKKERIQYGFQTIISTLISFFIVITGGLIFNIPDISVTFLIVFVLLRRFTGGFHANTYLKCNLCFVFVYLAIMIVTITAEKDFSSLKIESLLILFFSNIVIIGFAPVENANKPLTEMQKQKNRLISVLLTIFFSVISIFISIYNIRISLAIANTLFSIAVLILIVEFRRKEIKNE